MEKIKLKLIQPDRILLDDEIEHVIVPGVEGDFGVYVNHADFITKIRPGVLEVYSGEKIEEYAIHDGYVSVENNQVNIVCEAVEKQENIDRQRAEAAKERAEKRMKSSEEEVDFRRAELALKRSLVRLSLKK
ncbi:MAG: F0F1 ATP synthase subunit epsilon [Candidatus Cloacimonadales bacterium]